MQAASSTVNPAEHNARSNGCAAARSAANGDIMMFLQGSMDAIRASARSRRYAKVRGGLNWGASSHCISSVISAKGAGSAAEVGASRTTEPRRFESGHDARAARSADGPGTVRWQGLLPLIAGFLTNAAWKEVSAFEMPRADAGCRNDAQSPRCRVTRSGDEIGSSAGARVYWNG